ncbi:XRE family transcriptional regulator [Roseburia sp. AM23-20]|jgi:transcriptional regulator with XRE-family HTH domain|uniref:helix-turn-helix domain-containing protein n=1 Tax=Roseburia sp. AM23-20 TaxID=2292066 RepID=UPI000E52E806|nr:helix-turn-helix transcriptional regulator [Roseburia sp. AM23-20]RHF91786.1 XRE family transcriptional regulator [Roseburia sp. AM23-20]
MEAKELGAFIAQIRKENQMTQAQLAACLKVTDKAVSRWERGMGFPDIQTLEPLAEALGVTLTELMKCQKMQQQEVSVQDTDAVIEAGIDIAKYQQKMQRKKMMQGFGLIVAGAFVIFNAVYLHASVTFSAILPNSADGPAAVFYAGKLGDVKPYIWGMVGVAAIAGGIIRIIRGRR